MELGGFKENESEVIPDGSSLIPGSWCPSGKGSEVYCIWGVTRQSFSAL